ncbi:MAG: Ldh family oxidoreductase [Proteobacteria bacterium]|nr:Ldh family oxidoreductase [Pseudomonadota bacterium]
MKVAADRAEAFSKDILVKIGTPPEDAGIVAAHLVDADLRGVRSHGLLRLLKYVEQIESGYIANRAAITSSQVAPNMVRVDANHHFGIVAFHRLIPQLIDQTRKFGLACGAVVNCAHTGRIGAYTEILAEEFMWSFAFGGGGHRRLTEVAPFGGRQGVFDTNPYSISMPLDADRIATADFATSATAQGKLLVYRTNNKPAPADWIIDSEGRPTTNVCDFYDGGAMLPAGAHKGYGLGFMAELFGDAALGVPHELNWFMVAMDLNRFTSPGDYAASAAMLRSKIESCPPADGVAKVMWPGQPEVESKARQSAVGIEYAPDELRCLAALETRFGEKLV